MASLTIEVPPELLARFREQAERLGKTAEAWAAEWVANQVPEDRDAERRIAREALRRAGLLSELPALLREQARHPTATLEDVQTMLAECGGPTLSEIVMEQRGPRV